MGESPSLALTASASHSLSHTLTVSLPWMRNPCSRSKIQKKLFFFGGKKTKSQHGGSEAIGTSRFQSSECSELR